MIVLLIVLPGCGETPGQHSGAMSVFVSVPPQAYLAEQLAGEAVNVHVLVPRGQNPHNYEPTPQQIMALGRARLYFRTGIPLEKRVTAKLADTPAKLRIVDTTKGIDPAQAACQESHEHGPHAHGEMDPHVWLGPPELRIMAKNMAEALVAADSAHAAKYRARLDEIQARLDTLDAELREALTPFEGKTFFVYHPAFGYFARAYGLKQRAVETGGSQPTPKDLQQLIAEARSAGVSIIFVQPQFPDESAAAVADAIKGTVMPLDPMAYNVFDNLRTIAAQIRAALGADA